MTSPTARSSFTFLHCGDLHAGSGLAHGTEDENGNSRLVDFRAAWVRLCQTAVDRHVDVVLFGGDAFRDSRPSPAEKEAFAAGLDLLVNAGIPFIAAEGNHDKSKGNKPSALAIFEHYRGGDVRVFARPAVIPPTEERPVAIAVLPYVMRSHVAAGDPEFEKLSIDEQSHRLAELSLDVLRSLSAEADTYEAPLGSVLLAHGIITGAQIGAEGSTAFLREAVLPLPELKGLGFRYQAFAHLHRAQQLTPTIAYSGSVERIDFAEADGDKGGWRVGLGDGQVQTEWISSEPRPFVDIDLTGATDDVETYCTPDIQGAVVRVTYTATPELAKTVDHGAIRRALLDAGAVKVHGPFAKITHTVTEASDLLTEEADMLTGWHEWSKLQGLDGPQFDRLDRKVREALEVAG